MDLSISLQYQKQWLMSCVPSENVGIDIVRVFLCVLC